MAAQAAGCWSRRAFTRFRPNRPGGFLRLSFTMVEAGWVEAAARVVAEIILPETHGANASNTPGAASMRRAL